MFQAIKNIKQKAWKQVRQHYFLLVFLGISSAMLGSEFKDSAEMLKTSLESLRQTSSTIANMFGDTNGVFASIESLSENENIIGIISQAIINIFGEHRSFTVLFSMLLGILIILAILVSLQAIYKVVTRRMVLESMEYETVAWNRMRYLFKDIRWKSALKTMILVSIYEILWWLTIVGGFIKHYSYILVPYFVAENPNIPASKAIELSKNAMRGHKWECFLLDFSFAGWRILSVFTFGILNFLYTIPMQMCSYARYYQLRREEIINNKIKSYTYLNDQWLYVHAPEGILSERYHTVQKKWQELENFEVPMSKTQKFLAENLGIWIGSKENKIKYQSNSDKEFVLQESVNQMQGKSYPVRLSPNEDYSDETAAVNVMNVYPIWSLVVLFFAFSCVGWIWEVALHMVQYGSFVNRGTLHGPWLPIYGTGALTVLTLCTRFRKKPIAEFFSAIALCGAIEYFTSVILEMLFHERWWSYEGYFGNLNGRICLEGLLVFGIAAMLAVYLIAPIIDRAVTKAKPHILKAICSILISVFMIDVIWSSVHPNTGLGVTDEITSTQSNNQ